MSRVRIANLIVADTSTLTKTDPEPQDAAHDPPTKEIQFRWPSGVTPTETRGFNATAIRKSMASVGIGRTRSACGIDGTCSAGLCL